MNKWKSLDGECLFQDENGETFISSPEQSEWDYISIVMVAVTSPFWIGLIMWVGI